MPREPGTRLPRLQLVDASSERKSGNVAEPRPAELDVSQFLKESADLQDTADRNAKRPSVKGFSEGGKLALTATSLKAVTHEEDAGQLRMLFLQAGCTRAWNRRRSGSGCHPRLPDTVARSPVDAGWRRFCRKFRCQSSKIRKRQMRAEWSRRSWKCSSSRRRSPFSSK